MTEAAEVRAMLRLLTRTAASAHENGDRAAVTVTGHGLTRWQLLETVSKQEMTVPAAARVLRQSRQATQRLADALEREGLLERLPNPGHRTSPLLRVTPAGRDLLLAMDESVADWIGFFCEQMSAEEVADFTRLLERVDVIAEGYRKSGREDRSAAAAE